MQNLVLDNVLAQLRAALKRDDLERAAAIIVALSPPDQADLFAELNDRHQAVHQASSLSRVSLKMNLR